MPYVEEIRPRCSAILMGPRTTSLVEVRADQEASFTNVNMHAVLEIKILTGDIEAKYGGQSGIVSVVSRPVYCVRKPRNL